MNETLLELYRHKTWATLRLIEACQSLGDESLDMTTPGTYGTIRQTLEHLVAAEESYFTTATGEQVPPAPPGGPASLDQLAERIRRLGPRWEALAKDPDAAGREITTSDGWRVCAAVPMAQAIHHADDHRAHILSVLGAHGLEPPGLDIGEDLDVWHHAIATGVMREIGNGTG
jgi:uncharacterized damage-inducible protein DinB